MKHKILAVLLSAALPFTAITTGVYAATGVTLAAGSATAECKTGTEITVPVKAEQNAGFGAGTVDVTWDSTALTLKSVEYTEKAPAINPPEITAQGNYRAQFGDYHAKENFTATGEFFTMTFEVAATATPGDYAVILNNPSLYDTKLKEVPVSLKAGKITLTGDAPANSLLMEVDSAEVTVGDNGEIKVPVTAKQNPGFAAGTIDVLWDSAALTLSNVEYGTIAPDNGSAEIISDGNYRVSFGNHLAEKDTSTKGVMFTLVFKANATTPSGSYEIMLGNPNVYTAKLIAVPVTVKAGSVLVKEVTTTTTTATTTTSKTTSTSASATTTSSKTTSTSTSASITTSQTASTSTSATTTTSKTTSTSTSVTTTTSKTTSTSTSATTTTSKTTSTSTSATTTTSRTTSTSTSATTTTSRTTSTSTSATTTTSRTTSTSTSATTTSSKTTSTSTSATTTTSRTTSTSTSTTTTTSKTTSTSTGFTTTISTTSTSTTTTTTTTIPEYLFGDVNLDGTVNADDAQMALMAYIYQLAGKPTGISELQEHIADVDGSGTISADDAQYILMYAVKKLAGLNPEWSEIIKK